jgi:hypothetical protein
MTSEDKIFFKTLLDQLGQSLNLSDLDPDNEGLARLVIDELPLSIICQKGGLMFYSALGRLPTTAFQASRVRQQLLLANSLFQGTAGATLGVSAEGLISLCYHLSIRSIDLEQVMGVLNDFVNVAEFWIKNLEQSTEEETESDLLPENEADRDPQKETVNPDLKSPGSGLWLKL